MYILLKSNVDFNFTLRKFKDEKSAVKAMKDDFVAELKKLYSLNNEKYDIPENFDTLTLDNAMFRQKSAYISESTSGNIDWEIFNYDNIPVED